MRHQATNELAADTPVVVPVKTLARLFSVEERTVRDARWRRRVGLVAVRAGCHVLGAFPDDVRQALVREQHDGGDAA